MKQIIYISIAGKMQIEVWKLNNDFSMELLQKILIKGEPQPILILKTKRILYVGIRPKFCIYSYKIEPDGKLLEIGCELLPGSPNHFEIDQTEKFLFSSSYHFNCISVSPINLLGIPEPITQVIKNIQGCHASKINYDNTRLFVSSLKNNRIYLYNFIQDGILLENQYPFVITKNNSGPRHFELNQKSNHLFSINELKGSIDIWRIYKDKNLIKLLKTINIVSNQYVDSAWSSDLHISKCKKYLYASDRKENIISIIKLDKNINDIKKIGFIKTELQPRTFNISNSGRNLFVIGEKSNSMSIYDISENTGLLKLRNKCNIGLRPVWISSLIL